MMVSTTRMVAEDPIKEDRTVGRRPRMKPLQPIRRNAQRLRVGVSGMKDRARQVVLCL